MHVNKYTILSCIIITSFILLSIPLSKNVGGDNPTDEDWIIDGDTVYVDDSKVYASATPHTIYGADEVVFEFESKQYSGDVDFCWGFDETVMKPTNIWLWQNYSHPMYSWGEVEKYGCTIIKDVVSFTNLGIENYNDYNITLGNSNNTYLFNATYNNGLSNGTFAFATYENNSGDYTLCGHYNITDRIWNNQTYFDWNVWNVDYNHIEHNHKGMTDWYITPDINIQSDKRYKCKVKIKRVKWDLNGHNGKYWFAFKPSSESISEAISNEHFYCLDPWWSSSWNYYKPISINRSQVPSNLSYFPLLINITDSDLLAHVAQADAGDIAFTDSANSTQFPHVIERWNATLGVLSAWVNVSNLNGTDAGTNTVIHMYYNNSGCANQWDSTNTWDTGYENVFLFNDSNGGLTDSTANNNDAVETGGLPDSDDYLKPGIPTFSAQSDGTGADGGGEGWSTSTMTDTEMEGGFTIEAWAKFITSDKATYYIVGGSDDFSSIWNLNDGTGLEWWIIDESSTTNPIKSGVLLGNVFSYVGAVYDSSEANEMSLYLNGTLIGTNSSDTIKDKGAFTHYLATKYNNYWAMDGGYLDSVRISNLPRSADYLKTTYNSMANNSNSDNPTFLVVGAEHEAPNKTPTQSGESPPDGTTNISANPTLYVICSDDDTNNTLNATWWWGTDGSSWQSFGGNTSISLDTNISKSNSNFTSDYDQVYYWSVNLSDGHGGWNNESYSFTWQGLFDSENRSILTGISDGNSWDVHGLDFDGDGDTDVFTSSSVGVVDGGKYGFVAWSENGGDGQTWTTHYLDDDMTGCVHVDTEDLDSDGDYDVVVCSRDTVGGSGEGFIIFNNTGDDVTFNQHVAHLDAGSPMYAYVAWFADIDGQNFSDIVAVDPGQNELMWIENAGDIESWTHHVINASPDYHAVNVGDIDGDNDIDIVAGDGENTIEWWENDGSGSFSHHHIANSYDAPNRIILEDIDGDDDLDIVTGNYDTSPPILYGIDWIENDNGDGTSWTNHTVDRSLTNPRGFDTADVDYDGDIDIMSATLLENEITWFENDGTHLVWTKHTISTDVDEAVDVQAIDINGDNLLDLIASSDAANTFGGSIWFKNLGDFSPPAPTGLSATAINRTRIDLSWTNSGTNNTYIERNTVSSWARTSGTEIYNGTLTSYTDTGLSFGTTYYYQAWAWNQTANLYSTTNVSDDAATLSNVAPTVESPSPANNSVDQASAFTWSVWINDSEADTFDWTIECNNTQSNNANGDTNGSKTLALTGLAQNNQYTIWVNVTDGYDSTNATYYFTTETGAPLTPGTYYANSTNATAIDLEWVVGTNATHTYIERNTVSSWARGSGTEVYNDTGTSYTDTGLTASTNYTYRWWSYSSLVNLYSTTNVSDYAWTYPSDPTSVYANVSGSQLTFEWVNGTGCDTTVIVQKASSTPTNVTDGTIIYNNTNPTHTKTNYNSTDRFAVFTYNSTSNLYSSGVSAPYGALIVYVYKEDETWIAIGNYTIFITNNNATETYQNTPCNNPTYIGVEDIPNGEDIIIQISKQGYKTKSQTMDLLENNVYNVSFYLPASSEGSPDDEEGEDWYVNGSDLDNETLASHYIIFVKNDAEERVEDAFVEIKRFVNDTANFSDYDEYDVVLSAYTDGSGQVDADLIPDTVYYVTISHDDYYTENTFWTPPDISYVEDAYKTFYLTALPEDYPNETSPSDCITFTGEVTGTTGYVNLSNDAGTECGDFNNFSIWIYEINTTTNITSYFNSYNSTDQSIAITITMNVNNTYYVLAYINHTIFGTFWDSLYLNPEEITNHSKTSVSEFDDMFDNIFGDNNQLTWSAIFGLFILLVMLFAFDQKSAGVGIVITGIALLGFNAWLGLALLTTTVCVFIIIMGILLQWKLNRRYA